MGENGAGKSTLIKALTGVYTIDSGIDPGRGEQVDLHRAGAGAGRPASPRSTRRSTS